MSTYIKLLALVFVGMSLMGVLLAVEDEGQPSMQDLLEQLSEEDHETVQAAQKQLDDRFDETLILIDKIFDNGITEDKMYGVKLHLLNVLKRALKIEANAEKAEATLKKIINFDNKFSPIADDILHSYSEILRRLKALKFYDKRERKTYNFFNKWKKEQLKELTEIDLSYYQFGRDDLKYFCRLKKLTSINFYRSSVNNADLEIVKKLPHLTTLQLGFTHVTDKGVAQLKEIKGLTSLNLHGTEITDVAIESLKSMSTLTSLVLVDCKNVTKESVEALKKALTNCEIKYVLKISELPPKEKGE